MKAYFDPRGCDFYEKDNVGGSDVGNYRLLTCVMAKNGEPLIIEFTKWQRKEPYTTQYGNTRYRVVDENALCVNGSHVVYDARPGNFYGPTAGTYGVNFAMTFGIDPSAYHYTRADILRFLSDVTGGQYDEFVFDGEYVDELIATIYEPVEKAIYKQVSEEKFAIEEQRKQEHENAVAE